MPTLELARPDVAAVTSGSVGQRAWWWKRRGPRCGCRGDVGRDGNHGRTAVRPDRGVDMECESHAFAGIALAMP
ncbi:hypothetical protein HRbin30_02303 [bacterium HR30]|nr:hypothetical protein HRbin30_02303 [bacterium HR30]